MGAVYALLGLVFGVAITKAAQWRRGDTGTQYVDEPGHGPRCSSAPQLARDRCRTNYGRFTAQDYYDR